MSTSFVSKALQSLTKKMLGLQETIRTMIEESLAVEKYLDEHIKSIDQSVRMIKYEVPQTPRAEVGLIPHRDTNIITLMYQNHVHGLEVQDKDVNWIKVEPPPKSITVIAVESLNAWANGRFHVPLHRVTMTGNEAKYCIGMFIVPKEGHIIEAPKELVDEKHPLLYKPFDYLELKKFRQKAGVPNVELKSFCGV